MNHGFFRVAAAAPELKPGDCDYNLARVLETAETARRLGAGLLVLPELCLTGSTCGDLFAHAPLLRHACTSLLQLAQKTAAMPMLIVAGLPVAHSGAVYNCAAVLFGGSVLGLVPSSVLPGRGHGWRLFSPAPHRVESVRLGSYDIPMGQGLVFQNGLNPLFVLGIDTGDHALPLPPSALLCADGATVIAVPSAVPKNALSPATGGEAVRSGALLCGYVVAGAGMGESTTDHVYSGRCGVYECGETLDSIAPFEGGLAVSDLDLERIAFMRARRAAPAHQSFTPVLFELEVPADAPLKRGFERLPFIPKSSDGWRRVLDIQSAGLAKRLAHTGSKTAVIGVSGGLDSTLALIVTAQAFEKLGLEKSQITAVTMPCFGTSETTLKSARTLCAAFDIPLREIDITESVRRHFADIGHLGGEHDAAYENAQARERTQVLMDLANMHGGFVVGTGDMSELALGWTTYNGDHMSMYGVNAGVPKTLVRHVLERYAASCGSPALQAAITAVLATPVSPELLPAKGGQIAQLTEDIIGPYELHDFFLYHMLTGGCGPQKLYFMACAAFDGAYGGQTVRRWLDVFFRRFFTQQYKRSCLPDGVSVCGVSLSPRGGLQMPSDASAAAWVRELEAL